MNKVKTRARIERGELGIDRWTVYVIIFWERVSMRIWKDGEWLEG